VLAATILGVLLVPVFFVLIVRAGKRPEAVEVPHA
jgi:hypothetical protein